MLCFCVSQMNILQLLRQRKLRDGNQPNSVSDNVHDYSSSLAAPVSADPNSCQSNKYSLPCLEFSSIKFAMQLESLYLTWFMCNSFLWTYSWLHVLSAQLHQDSSTYLHTPSKLKRGKMMKVWRSVEEQKWTYAETSLNALFPIYL